MCNICNERMRYIGNDLHKKMEIERKTKKKSSRNTSCWSRKRKRGRSAKGAWEEKRSLSAMTGSEVIVAGEFNVPLWTRPLHCTSPVCTNLPKSLTRASSRNLLPSYPLRPSRPSHLRDFRHCKTRVIASRRTSTITRWWLCCWVSGTYTVVSLSSRYLSNL